MADARGEHIKDGVIQTWLDDELPAGLATVVARHLDQCGRCQERGRLLSEKTGRISLLLLSLDADPVDLDAVRSWIRPRPEVRSSKRSPARDYPQLDLLAPLAPGAKWAAVEPPPLPLEFDPPPQPSIPKEEAEPYPWPPLTGPAASPEKAARLEPRTTLPRVRLERDFRLPRGWILGWGGVLALLVILGLGLLTWIRSAPTGALGGTTGEWDPSGGVEGEGGSVLAVELREGRLDVVLRAPHPEVGVELQVGVGERVEITAPLGSLYFPTQGRVEVDLDRTEPGTLFIRIPAIAREVNLVVGLRPVLTWTGGTYRMEEGVPAQTRGESVRIELPDLEPQQD
jgi:hypothetical protein